MKNKNELFAAGIVACIACLIGTISDTMLLYNPDGGYLSGDYKFLATIDLTRIKVGAFLGVISIPVSLLGLWQISKMVEPAGKFKSYSIVALGTWIMFPGLIYHAGTYILALLMQYPVFAEDSYIGLTELFINFLNGFAGIFVLGFFVLCGWVFYIIKNFPTHYPKWFMYINPLPVYLIVLLSYFVIPSIGNLLLPTAFNLALLVVFLVSTFYIKSKG